MIKRLLLLTIIFSASIINAQEGTISGRIVTQKNNPISNVNVLIKNTDKGIISNRFGEFKIQNVQPGNYTLSITFIGYKSKSIPFTINNGQKLRLPKIVLVENQEQLTEIVVNGFKKNKFSKKTSQFVSKMPLAKLENPQVYNSISNELLKEQVVTNVNDALKNATGISRLWESTGRASDGAEFYSLRGFAVQPTLINGLPGLNNGGLDPSNIESIEVIKGPSGTLFGSSLISYGGLINVTTKKPYESFGGEISYTTGTYGLNRVTADINTPIGTNDDTFLRINTAYHTQNSFQDAGLNKSIYVAPSLKFIANEKLTFLVNTEILEKTSVNTPMLFLNRNVPLSFNSLDLFEKNYYNSFTSDNLSIDNPIFNFQAQALYNISDNWTSQTLVSSGNAKTSGFYSYLWDSGDGDSFTHYAAKINAETRTTDIQQNFIGKFNLGKLKNRIVIGFDYFSIFKKDNSTGWSGIGTVTLSNSTTTSVLSNAAVDAILADTNVSNSSATQETYSAYVSDVVNITPSLSAMLSLRIDQFGGDKSDDDDNQTAFSPKFGLVYQPIKDKVSIFTNYMNGFTNVAPTSVSDVDGSNPRIKTFEAEKANQFEFGVKTNLFDEKLDLTASYYNINVSNKLMTDPTNVNNSIQGGEVESSGVEISLIANPIIGWNIIAGYSNNDSEVLVDTANSGYLGLRTESAGPKDLFNFWTSYNFQSETLKGFGIGLGGNYASEFNTLNRSTTGSFTLPSYTILNSSISYSQEKFMVILKVDNIANTKYYSGWSTVSPQKLRTVSANFTYRF